MNKKQINTILKNIFFGKVAINFISFTDNGNDIKINFELKEDGIIKDVTIPKTVLQDITKQRSYK